MPDPYWEKIGKELQQEKGNKAESAFPRRDDGMPPNETFICKHCKERFYSARPRIICDDCRGERSENRPPQMFEGFSLRDDV